MHCNIEMSRKLHVQCYFQIKTYVQCNTAWWNHWEMLSRYNKHRYARGVARGVLGAWTPQSEAQSLELPPPPWNDTLYMCQWRDAILSPGQPPVPLLSLHHFEKSIYAPALCHECRHNWFDSLEVFDFSI